MQVAGVDEDTARFNIERMLAVPGGPDVYQMGDPNERFNFGLDSHLVVT